MIHKQRRSKQILNKAGRGSSVSQLDEILAKPKIDSRLFLEDSTLLEGNDSTTIGRYTVEDVLSRKASPNFLGTLSPSASYLKSDVTLPFLSVKNSSFSRQNKPGFFSREMTQTLSPSNLLKIVSKKGGSPTNAGRDGSKKPTMMENKRYERIVVNKNEDFSSMYFLKKLKKVFLSKLRKENKAVAYIDGARKFISVTFAKKIIGSLEEELKAYQKQEPLSNLLGNQNFLESIQQLNEQHNMIETLDTAITDIFNVTTRLLEDVKNKGHLEACLKEIVEIAHKSNNAELLLYCIYTQAKVYFARNEFKDAIVHFKHYKNLCKSRRVFQNRIYAFKHLGKCYQYLKRYRSALTYFTKFLQMAWYVGSSKYELLAYDLIGKQYFYLGEVNKATAYHNKMMCGKLEPQGSGLQQIAFYKITLRKEFIHNTYQPNMQVRAPKSRAKNIAEEEQDDSSLDEAVDLPTPPPEEADGDNLPPVERRDTTTTTTSTSVEEQKRRQSFDKKLAMKKNSDRFFTGLKKVTLLKNKEERNARFNSLSKKPALDHGAFKRPDDFDNRRADEKPKPACVLNIKVSDQILVSHLSRNRNLKNFSALLPQDVTMEEMMNETMQVTVGSSVEERVRLVIEKFRVNLKLIKESMKVFEVEEGNLSPIHFKKKGKGVDLTPGLKKNFFPLGFPCKTDL